MGEDGSKLLENLMGMLGDNPSETLGQMLSVLSGGKADNQEQTAEGSENKENASAGQFDPSVLFKIQGLMGQFNQNEADDRSALLAAIRPFLSEERRPQVDQAIKFLKLSKLAKTAQEMDLFKDLL